MIVGFFLATSVVELGWIVVDAVVNSVVGVDASSMMVVEKEPSGESAVDVVVVADCRISNPGSCEATPSVERSRSATASSTT